MKSLVSTIMLVIAAVAYAQSPSVTPAQQPVADAGAKTDRPTPDQQEERAKKMKAMFLKRTGGFVSRPGSQKGRIVFVNAQKAAKKEWMQEIADSFIAQTKLNVTVEDGEFSFPEPKIVGSASVFVIDDPAMPPELSAPQSKWSMINVAPLKKGAGEKPAFFHARCMKELTRGFCLVAGTQDSNYPQALIGPILKPEDLDQHADWRLPVDVIDRFTKYSSAYGVTPRIDTTYRVACREGWAAAPTNDAQKAIWDQFHEIPTEPMVIKPEKHPAE